MPERASVGSVTQVGVEVTPGTAVACNKQIQSAVIMVRDTPKTVAHTMQGAKHPGSILLAQESTEATLTGWPAYAADVYWWSCLYGAASISSIGVGSNKWLFQPAGVNADTPKNLTVQNGSSVRAHQFAFGTLTDYGWKWSRKDITLDGKMIGQQLTDNISLTGSPTIIADIPVDPDDLQVYLDTTSGGLGTTRLTRVFSCDFSVAGKYGPIWPSDRSHMDWTAVVDLVHKLEVKMLVEADAAGMAILANLRANNANGSNPTYYLRLQHQGAVMPNENIQVCTISGSPTGGTFTLTYKGQTTAGIAYNALASAVQTALQGLSTVGASNMTVAGSAGGPYTITSAAALAFDPTLLTTNGAALTGGSSPTSAITSSQQFYLYQQDIAVKVTDVAEFKDEEGVYAIEYTLEAVYDPTWGHAHIVTMQNQLSGL